MSDYCPCGGIILADTEDWTVPVCYECWVKLGEPEQDPGAGVVAMLPQPMKKESEMDITIVGIPGPSRKLKGRWPEDFIGKPSPLKPEGIECTNTLGPYPDFPVTGDENDE